MDFEQDPADEFLKREREELGDLEDEIIASNGKSDVCFTKTFLCDLKNFSSYWLPVVTAAAAPNEALSSDDFEMINNDLSTEGADNDGKIYLWIISFDPDVIELIAIF